jgi:uncharacterized protein (DUF1330 family)
VGKRMDLPPGTLNSLLAPTFDAHTAVRNHINLFANYKEHEVIMSVYLVIEIEVKDNELYSRYIDKAPDIVKKYGGRYLVQSGKVVPLSGNWQPEKIVLIEFASFDQVRKCFKSPEYLEIAPLREQSTASKSILVEGCSLPE